MRSKHSLLSIEIIEIGGKSDHKMTAEEISERKNVHDLYKI